MSNLKSHTQESKRLNELRSYDILDSLTEQEYENITYLASVICEVPIAVISFVDENRQWFKSHLGLPNSETLREYSFCAHAIHATQEFLIVPDSTMDERFMNNPLVTGDPNIVFYAGVPLVTENGFGLGTVCVIDRKPRQLTEVQLKALKMLSSQVMTLLEARKTNADLELVKLQLELKNKDLEVLNKKLERSEERLRTMSEGTDVLIAVVDDDNDPTFFSKAWNLLTGKSLEELLLFGWADLIHTDDKEAYLDTYLEAFENKAPYSVEFRILTSKGNYSWVLSQGSPRMDANGCFAGYISSAVDISKRKDIENDLAATTSRLELALEAGSLGTYELNLKSGHMKTSGRYNQNFGLNEDAVCNFSMLLSMIVIEDRPEVHRAFVRSAKENIIYDAEYRIQTPAGAIRWMHGLGIPVYNEKGEAMQMYGVLTDITAQKTFTAELEKQVKERTNELNRQNIHLENVNKELESFAFISSHDLQEPLRKIETYTSQILEEEHDSLSAGGKEYFKRMQYASIRMRNLIRDLLEYSRSTGSPHNYEWTDLAKLVEEVKEDFKEEFQQKQAVVTILNPSNLMVIPSQFKRLLQNLFGNSIKFSKQDVPLKITIACKQVNDLSITNKNVFPGTEYCHLSIADNGIGFNQQFSEKIFELFQRLNGKSDLRGTGIGLSIVKKIVANHNGFITATSSLQEGATFHIYLPADQSKVS